MTPKTADSQVASSFGRHCQVAGAALGYAIYKPNETGGLRESNMEGTFLKFYVSEYREHNGILLFEWLLEHAKKCGFNGGTAMRAVAGFGRHGILHEETFLELAADLPVEVSFILSKDEAKLFLDLLDAENIDLLYVKFPVEYGFLPANNIGDWREGRSRNL